MTEHTRDGKQSDASSVMTAETWLLNELRGVRVLLLTVVAFSVGIGLLTVSQARCLSEACHRVVIQGQDLAAITPSAAILLLLTLSRAVLSYVIEINAAAAAARVKHSVRSRLYRTVQARGPAGRIGYDNGAVVETVTKGVDELETYITRFIPQVVLAAVLPLLFLIVLMPAEWRSGLVLLFSAPFIPLFMVLIGKGSEILHQRQWNRLAHLSGYLLDRVMGLPDLIVSGAVKREVEEVTRLSGEYRSATMTVLRVAFLSAFALEFFATVGTAVVAVIIGFRLLGGAMGLNDGLFVLLLAPEFYLPLRNLGLSYHARMQGRAAAARILPLLLEIPSGDVLLAEPFVGSAPPSVSFQEVSFRYAEERGGVAGINLELPSGSITALAGESGAGKSTIGRLLIGLLKPQEGRVLVDGRDLSGIDPDSWRSRLAWVPQAPYFIAGTLRENLLLGTPAASETEINEALQAAAAYDFIQGLPAGLDTRLGDRGAGLSGGELKRLALARVYLRRADLIVLDEPTAGLDAHSELLVCRALQSVARGRTVLVISHREETLRCADRVVEMADGRLNRILSASDYLGEGESAR